MPIHEVIKINPTKIKLKTTYKNYILMVDGIEYL